VDSSISVASPVGTVTGETTVGPAAAGEMLFWQNHLPSALLFEWREQLVHRRHHHIQQRAPAASENTESFA
jgi:hypothetical protein